MTVNITMSSVSAADAFTDQLVALGEINSGASSTEQDIFITHDSIAAITECAWYITRYVGSDYPGSDADADLVEILGWGDDGVVAGGGLLLNQTIPVGWSTGTSFDAVVANWTLFASGTGETDSQITLDKDAISVGSASVDGTIPLSGEAHVQIKMQIPSSISGAGHRGVLLVFAFSAIS